MARAEAKIKDGAAPYLEDGEEVLAAMVARPRGWTQSNASPGGGAVARAERSTPPRTSSPIAQAGH